jgi:hypothetical protein
MKKRTKRAIILRLDEHVLDRVDEVRTPLRINRSTWLRKVVARNLHFTTDHELPVVARKEIQSVLMPECL